MRKERISDDIMRLNFYNTHEDNAFIKQYFDSGEPKYYLGNNIFYRSAEDKHIWSPDYQYKDTELFYYSCKYGIYEKILDIHANNTKII